MLPLGSSQQAATAPPIPSQRHHIITRDSPSLPSTKHKVLTHISQHRGPQDPRTTTSSGVRYPGDEAHRVVPWRSDARGSKYPSPPPHRCQAITARYITINHPYPPAPIPPTTRLKGTFTAHFQTHPFVTNILPAPPSSTRQHNTGTSALRTIATCSNPQTHAHLCKQLAIYQLSHTHHRTTLMLHKTRIHQTILGYMDDAGWTWGCGCSIHIPPPRSTPTLQQTIEPRSPMTSASYRTPHTCTPVCHSVVKQHALPKYANPTAGKKL